MPLIVQTVPPTPGADSYISVEDADLYISKYVDGEWNDLTVQQKEVALRVAARYLDSSVTWTVGKLTEDQTLEWPKEPFYDNRGNYIEDIPAVIGEVQAELAAIQGSQNLFSLGNAGIKSETWGNSHVEYSGFRTGATTSLINSLLKRLSLYSTNVSTSVITLYRA